jgi:hypothetical protein
MGVSKMIAFFFDRLTWMTVATALALGACGGGGADPAVAATPAPEVFVTMVRGISYGETRNGIQVLDNDATTVIAAVANAGIRVRAIRCAALSGPLNKITVAALSPVLFMDVYLEDVEKLKAFQFLDFSTIDQPGSIYEESCARVKSPYYL